MIPTATTDMEEMIMTVPISDTATLEGGLLVRKATGQDRAAVVETLTTAFFDDPVMSWWVLDPARRSEILRACFEIIVDVNHPHEHNHYGIECRNISVDRSADNAAHLPLCHRAVAACVDGAHRHVHRAAVSRRVQPLHVARYQHGTFYL